MYEFIKFWDKVVISGEDECWEWTGARDRGGYGSFTHKGVTLKAHRVSWVEFNKKEVPSGLYVCHSCDNRLCVNPAHLWIGTAKDNTQDMMKKGRHVKRGSMNKDQCNNGHPLCGENLSVDKRGWRRCVICRKASAKRNNAKQYAKIRAARIESQKLLFKQ